VAVIKAKPEKIVDFFLGLVQRESLGSNLVTRVSDDFFKGALNDTVSMRIGALRAVAREYEWRTRTAPIVLDDIEGGETIDIKLDKHVYSATALTDEHLTMDEIEFATEVLLPQVAAVTGNFEAKVVSGFRAMDFKHTVTSTLSEDPHLVTLEAKRLLNSSKVAPSQGRVFLVGSDVAAAWAASDRLSKYDWIGDSASQTVRENTIGRLAGAPVVENSELDPAEAYYFHRSALVLGSVAPVAPRGATASAKATRDGYTVRWLMDYDPNFLRDRSVVNAFVGINEIKDERTADGSELVADPSNVRAVKLTLSGTGSVLD
jgi:hypothetical protein